MLILAPIESADSQLLIGAKITTGGHHHKMVVASIRPTTPNPPKSRPSQKFKKLMSATVVESSYRANTIARRGDVIRR